MYRLLRTSCLLRDPRGLSQVGRRQFVIPCSDCSMITNKRFRVLGSLEICLVALFMYRAIPWVFLKWKNQNNKPHLWFLNRKKHVGDMLWRLFPLSLLWIFKCYILVKPTVWCGVSVLIVNLISALLSTNSF